jgi:hypothetical protein
MLCYFPQPDVIFAAVPKKDDFQSAGVNKTQRRPTPKLFEINIFPTIYCSTRFSSIFPRKLMIPTHQGDSGALPNPQKGNRRNEGSLSPRKILA